MKTRRRLLISLLAPAIVCACGGSDEPALDAIEIVSVTPTSAVAGTNTEVTVTFRYTLVTTKTGVIDMGFFVDDTNQLLTGQTLIVTAGSGQGSLKAWADPTNYTTTANFGVGVLLSEEPHPQSWTPLARARKAIAVTK